MDYEFIFKDPVTGATIVQKLSKINKNYKSVRSAFYAFRRHTAKVMGVTLKHITQFSEIKEEK